MKQINLLNNFKFQLIKGSMPINQVGYQSYYSTLGGSPKEQVLYSINHCKSEDLSYDLIRPYIDEITLHDMRSDKRLFIFIKWLEEHKDTEVLTYSDLTDLSNRVKSVQRWYKATSKEFSLLNSAPEWIVLDDSLTKHWESKFSKILLDIKEAKRKTTKLKEQAFSEYSKKIETFDADLQKQLYHKFSENPVLLINEITIQSLPHKLVEKTLRMDKESRDLALVSILNDYKLDLMYKLNAKEITFESLLSLVEKGV